MPAVFTEEDIRGMVKELVESEGLVAASRLMNCSYYYVRDFIRGNRHPGPMILRGIGQATEKGTEFEVVTTYVRKKV